jgi:hypothetical protein
MSIDAWEKIAPYIDYKLKAIEHTGEIDVTEHSSMSEVSNRIRELTGERSDTDTSDSVPH